MLYLRSWIEEYIDLTDYSNDELKEIITMKSGEVEEITEITDYFEGKVLIGKIENTRKHPDADRLRIFDVNFGDHSIQIVSAAGNVRDGLIIPTATVGCKLPIMTILERKMRGEVSQGMCLGMSELLLETKFSTGLWELNEILSAKKISENDYLGKSICEILPEYFPKDSVIDIKYLADKISACGNHLGLAQEIAICLEKPELLTEKAKNLLNPESLLKNLKNDISNNSKPELEIDFKDQSNYSETLSLFEIKVDDEYDLPHKLATRMFLTEANMIGGFADLSNYLLKDVGHPNHFFSQEKLKSINGNKPNLELTIQKVTTQRVFTGLGQLKKTEIPAGVDILIQDENILTIPGISGGEDTKVTKEDKSILVEIANFPSQNVATSSFSLNYRSDGARIWAGGVNLSLQFLCLSRLLQILSESEGVNFKLNPNLIYINPELKKLCEISESEGFITKVEKVLKFAGNYDLKVDIDSIINRLDDQEQDRWKEKVVSKLPLLGNYDQESGTLYPEIFYGKLKNTEDVLEQVSRLIGYDQLEADYLSFNNSQSRSKEYTELNNWRSVFQDFGFQEILTRPFISESDLIHDKHDCLKVLNPYNSEFGYWRDSLFPTLLRSANQNLLDGQKNIQLFETTKVYTNGENSKIKEHAVIEAVDVSDDPVKLTSVIWKIAEKIGDTTPVISVIDHPYSKLGEGFKYTFEKAKISANLLRIHNKQKRYFGIPLNKEVWYLALDITNWKDSIEIYPKYRNQTDFPTISRSFSYLVDHNLNLNEVLKSIHEIQTNEIEVLIKPIERIYQEDWDILNINVEFISYSRSLETSEVENWEKELLNNLGAQIKPRY